MVTLEQAARQALEALEACLGWPHAIAALREALQEEALQRLSDIHQEMEQPAQEADGVEVIEHVRNCHYKVRSRYHLENGTKLYTRPQREWVGLTDEDYMKIYRRSIWDDTPEGWDYERAIEAALKEKNT